MASSDFGLVRYEYRKGDGKGRTFIAYQTPSTLVRATRYETDNGFAAGILLPYYAAQAAGIIGQMKVEMPVDGSDLDRALALFDVYSFRQVPLDDEGNELAEPEGEPDPTAPSAPASAS